MITTTANYYMTRTAITTRDNNIHIIDSYEALIDCVKQYMGQDTADCINNFVNELLDDINDED